MNILIAVPTFENILPETFKSIYGLTSKEWLSFTYVRGYDCAKARNEIVKEAIKGYDYVLMVDSDIVLQQDTLELMLEDPVDILLGCYPAKNSNAGDIELFKLGTKDFTKKYTKAELPDDRRIQVKGGGAGCLLVKTSVFEKIKFPWFQYVQYENGTILGEDCYFFMRAAQAGYKIYADTRVRCGHAIRRVQHI